MVGIINGLSILFLTTVSGAIFFGCWWLFCRVIDKEDWLAFVYFGLRCVILAFLVPIAYLLFFMAVLGPNFLGQRLDHFWPTNLMVKVLPVFGVIWLAGLIAVELFYWRMQIQAMKRLQQYAKPAGPELQVMLQDCKNRVGIFKEVELFVLSELPTAFVKGAFRPCIYLPTGCEASQYEVMLIHELLHVKQGDLFWGWLLRIAQVIHWFNPIVWLLGKAVKECDEVCVDYEACSKLVEKRRYMDLMTACSMLGARDAGQYLNARSLSRGGQKLMARLEKIQKYTAIGEQFDMISYVYAFSFVLASLLGTISLLSAMMF